MNVYRSVRIYPAIAVAVLIMSPGSASAQTAATPAKAGSQKSTVQRDGRHDYDFLPGTWRGYVKRRLHPLTGSTQWVKYDATSRVTKVWGGEANLDEFEIDGPVHVKGLTLRIYNPRTHQWSLYWVTDKAGTLRPQVGGFKNGRGEFYAQDTYNGRTIFIRYVWSDISRNSYHFEQSFSDDGGKTWEVNWISTMTRVKDISDKSQ